MLNTRTRLLILSFALLAVRTASAQVNDNTNVPADRVAARAKYQDAKFGMFIHWGAYSQLAKGEWVMQNDGISIPNYEWLASSFTPVRFNAREWVSRLDSGRC